MTNPPTDTIPLKQTRSRCPRCGILCPATVSRVGSGSLASPDTIVLSRTCPEHGDTSDTISSDARFYWLSKGASGDCGEGCACSASPDGNTGTLGKNATPSPDSTIETLSTCLALIEIVDSCNLRCPTCYAASPHGVGAGLDYVPLTELQRRIQAAIDRKGKIEILQLSGGEPTLHPDFFQLLRWLQEHPGVDYVLVNTNGVRIASDDEFAHRLGETYAYGGVQLYLQFDGTQEAGQQALRGADLRPTREKTLRRCREMSLPVTLAMTVTRDNLPSLWDAVHFGLTFDNIRGISFQPMFYAGRAPDQSSPRLNTADIILALVAQAGGDLTFDDFTPLPCGDPNCATIGYLIKTPAGTRSVSHFVDFSQVQGFLRDKVRYNLDDLAQCGCESEPLGQLLHDFELDEHHTFRLFIKPFMDNSDWDEDRIDRCCTHVIRPDGRLDSFCRYYSTPPA